MNYHTVEDLLMDEGFLAWYYHISEAEVEKWNAWINASEANRKLAEKAVGFIVGLGEITEEAIPENYVDSILSRLDEDITLQPQTAARSGLPAQPLSTSTVRPVNPVKTRSMILLRNYFKVGFRSLVQNKMHSVLNITGLSVGMAVAMLIGLWIWDECSFNQYHQHYDRIVQIFTHSYGQGQDGTNGGTPVPMAAELRKRFPEDFVRVTAINDMQFLMRAGDNNIIEHGFTMEANAPDMLTLEMIHGSRQGLQQPNSILLSASVAKKLYGNSDPIGKDLRLNNTYTVRVSGVYADPPRNSDFSSSAFIVPWEFFIANWDWIRRIKDDWNANVCGTIAELAPNADLAKVNNKIKGLLNEKRPEPHYKNDLFCYPMSRWHLHSDFKNGQESGGFIVYVRLFGIIGSFVLLLACINFMNLSTARSERRAREVGIRKTMGSARSQLIGQFFTESVVLSLFAFTVAIALTWIAMPWFNHLADKQLTVPFAAPQFWLAGLGFAIFTGIVAGSYPALYLSSFQPVKVLKGSFRAGRLATVPRKVLVVLQFTVSVILIIGTSVIFRQINFARERPVGYDRTGLISIQERTQEVYKNYNLIRRDLIRYGYAADMSESQCPVTDIWAGAGGFDWQGKPSSMDAHFAVFSIRHTFGKTVGWHFAQGRDFDPQMPTDSSGIILNESAVKYMGIGDPLGKTITWNKENYRVLGVVKDMIMTSPYQPVPPTVFTILREGGNFLNIRLNPGISVSAALKGVEKVFKEWDPAAPFQYSFANEDYAKKFSSEERIGQLASVFASLAIFISCLGLFGLVSFMAEQRTREIGVRKVLGATIYNIWQLLSKDFVLLVALSLLISIPLAWYFMHDWLQHYEYRAPLSWWIFAAAGLTAMIITLLTVSIQAVRAALANPTRSLRTE